MQLGNGVEDIVRVLKDLQEQFARESTLDGMSTQISKGVVQKKQTRAKTKLDKQIMQTFQQVIDMLTVKDNTGAIKARQRDERRCRTVSESSDCFVRAPKTTSRRPM